MKNQRQNLVSESNGGGLSERPKSALGLMTPAVLPNDDGGFTPCPDLLTEEELIRFLRIPEISAAKDYRNVIENLKRVHDLPRIHICGRALYSREAIKDWIAKKTTTGR